MDRIGQLPDEILLRILSILPSTKDVVATMVLSKRWQFLWTLVPKLVYDDSYLNLEYGRFSRFVDRSLFLHEAPVIETLHFRLGETCGSGDIRLWIRAADKCCLCELIIEIDTSSTRKYPVTLPKSLYSGGCRKLASLKLSNAVLVDADVTSPISFPNLKKLRLWSIKYPGDGFVNRLLSNCPVLEELVVNRCHNDNVTIFTVRVPSLKSLFLQKPYEKFTDDARGFVIDAPSLECLNIFDDAHGFCVVESDMPKIVEANLNISHAHTNQLFGSITSAKRLYLCLPTSKDAYPVGSVFHRLMYLKLCTCETEWLNLLMCVLRDSPNLKALKLKQGHSLRPTEPRPCWNEPSSVPECLLSSLETFEWAYYNGTEEEKEVASFIIRSGRCLKKVTISSRSTDSDKKKLEMLKELSFSFRRSSTCRVVFN